MRQAVRKSSASRSLKNAPIVSITANGAGSDDFGWMDQLSTMLRRRQIGEGFALLDETEPIWTSSKLTKRSRADLLLVIAQWVDVGYRNAHFLRQLLDRVSESERLQLCVSDYVRIRMAEAFYALATDDADGTIRALDLALRLDRELLDENLRTLAHLWKGRAHRQKADYAHAAEDIDAALKLAGSMPDARTVVAVIQVQQGWLVFQQGGEEAALAIFDAAEAVLRQTDHWVALGNIASARGRIIRRKGDYVRSLHHFEEAVKFYAVRHPAHPNLARAMTNMAFVKRLLALQLKRHIDALASRREPGARGRKGDGGAGSGIGFRSLHAQYQDFYRSAIQALEQAKSICTLNEHHNGLAAALLNAGQLHLDVGDLDMAEKEAAEAGEIGEKTNGIVLKARVHILRGLIENARLEELVGHPDDAPAFARRARQHCMEAVNLAEGTGNKRLLVNAQLALGEVAINAFFCDYEMARRCADTASALVSSDDADYVIDELNALKARLLQTVGIDDTLRGWSQGLVSGKSLQQIMEEFAGLVVTQVWLREGRRISRVAKQLAMSPKKVRRLVRHTGMSEL